MSNLITIKQEKKLNGLRGLTEAMNEITNSFPDSQCPLLKTQIAELRKLADAVSILASNVGINE